MDKFSFNYGNLMLNLQADEEERSTIEIKIQTAIAAYNDPNCLINF